MTQEQVIQNIQPRISMTSPAFHPVMRAMYGLEDPLRHSTLEPTLRELVKTRASQINGCAYCLDMHTKDARAQGETEQRLYALNAWRETPFYNDRERAALEWTEHLTLIATKDISDELYARVRISSTKKKSSFLLSPCANQRLQPLRHSLPSPRWHLSTV